MRVWTRLVSSKFVASALAALLLAIAVPVQRPIAATESQAVAAAQACSLSWVGQESAIEEFLRTAPVAKVEEVPIGVTKPRRALFAPGGLVGRAAWKVLPPGYRSGFRESYKAELAGYALDRYLDLHMVPPVVERQVDGKTGAMIYWVENTKMWDNKVPPTGPEPRWSQQITRMKMYDRLAANIDRNAGNILYDEDGHIFLIDHSRAFTDRKDSKGTAELTRVDRALWAKMEGMTLESLKAALGEWVSDKELQAMLVRRDRMKEEIAKLVAQRGEAAVFF